MNVQRMIGWNGMTRALAFVTLVGLCLVYIFPFFWMISTSLKTYIEAIQFPPTWMPKIPQFQNYITAWELVNVLHFGKNSVIVTGATLLGQLFVCIPAAYAFAKKKFPLAKFLFGFVLIDLMLPPQVTFVPIFVLLSQFGWIDTYQGLIVPFMYSSFNIFFMTQAFRQIPDEMIDAAKLDRAGELKLMAQVLLPIARPFILTVALFTFIHKWNDYFWTLILTNSESVRTLPIAVKGLLDIGDGINQWNISMAGNLILIAPVLILYLFANRFIKKAMTYGGIQ